MAAIQRFGAIYNKQQTQCLEKNNLCKDCILILEPCFEVLLVLVNKKISIELSLFLLKILSSYRKQITYIKVLSKS